MQQNVNTIESTTTTFRRLWHKSPKLAVAFLHRKVTKQAKKIIPLDEWKENWLGEEMRPFNSHHQHS